MILTVGNIKGGVGKSTIACNIAGRLAASGDVLLIDGDKQGSAADFAAVRSQRPDVAQFTHVRAAGHELANQVRQMAGKYDHVIIDAGGQDNPSLRAGLVVSEMVLIPVSPRSFDTWALDGLTELVREAQIANPALQVRSILNLCFARGQDNDQTRQIVREDYPALNLLTAQIGQRKA
ncbi:AAA family ATPase, partial [Roseibium aggregatum]|uniref:AAA family ATPase n=1 Tax=Roseibium aggregatum TaxID=187304 RepID=UPI0006E23644